MNPPEEIVYTDEVAFSLLKGVIIVPIGMVSFSFLLALLLGDVTVGELAPTCAGFWVLWGLGVGIYWLITRGQRLSEKMAIRKMFEGEIWESWQFSAMQWQKLVEAESELISPKGEGLQAYVGAVYSSIVGAILAVIMAVVGRFAMDDPVGRAAIYYSAVGVFLLLLGIGLFQPVWARYEALRYERKAMRVAAPRVWYGPDAIYEETLGYFSLKDLEKVTDQTRSSQQIKFTITIETADSTASVPYPFPVPDGCEDRASALVRRYRQERLIPGE
ncbi:MAG: hypothetical protein ACK2T7_09660 [Anaerolineales bacterium]